MTAACTFGLSAAIALAMPDGADVVLRNKLSSGHPNETRCTINLDGLEIGIVWHHRPGNAPDAVEVIPPPGYTVDPPLSVVPENDETIARVRAILMG